MDCNNVSSSHSRLLRLSQRSRVFVPSDLDELREIVLASSIEHVPLTVAGTGTGLTGGRVPHGGWIVSLERFRDIQIQHGRARAERAPFSAICNKLPREQDSSSAPIQPERQLLSGHRQH